MFFPFMLATLLSTAFASPPPNYPFLPPKMDKTIACQKVFQIAQGFNFKAPIDMDSHVTPSDLTERGIALYSAYLLSKSQRIVMVSKQSVRSVPFYDGIVLDVNSKPVANFKIEKVKKRGSLLAAGMNYVDKLRNIALPETWLNLYSTFRYAPETLDIALQHKQQFYSDLIEWASMTMHFYGIWESRATQVLIEYEGGAIENHLSPVKLGILKFAIEHSKYQEASSAGSPIVDTVIFVSETNLVVLTANGIEKMEVAGR